VRQQLFLAARSTLRLHELARAPPPRTALFRSDGGGCGHQDVRGRDHARRTLGEAARIAARPLACPRLDGEMLHRQQGVVRHAPAELAGAAPRRRAERCGERPGRFDARHPAAGGGERSARGCEQLHEGQQDDDVTQRHVLVRSPGSNVLGDRRPTGRRRRHRDAIGLSLP
jgi:hypothetical protein